MSSWQHDLLDKLVLDESFSYLIHDPDQLCLEPYIQKAIQKSQAVMVNYEDPVALRLSYEQCLEVRNSGQRVAFIVTYDHDDQSVPWDIVQDSKALDFHVSNLIPEIDASVLRELPSAFYDDVRTAIDVYKPGKMSEQASRAFVLRHIFKIAPEIIQSDVDLVRLLIRKHYLSLEMPLSVERFLVATLKLNPRFSGWPLRRLVSDRVAFFDLLQKQWLLYLESVTGIENKLIIPFADHDIRVFINNLFAEGYLTPVVFEGVPEDHWARIGIVSDNDNTLLEQYKHLYHIVSERFKALQQSLQREEKIRSADWGVVAQDMGRLKALSYDLLSELSAEQTAELSSLENAVEALFCQWVQESYSSLLHEPGIKSPVIVHKVTPWLQQRFVANNQRVCLLVMDGMGFQQWTIVKKHIQTSPALRVEDGHCFAWIPTITSISRQALFAGKAPFYFSNDLLSTTNEGRHWRTFWQAEGLNDRQIGYQKKLETMDADSYSTLVESRRLKVLGAVINYIDDQMHGIIETGMAGLNGMVSTWLQQWQFVSKLEGLVQAGFTVVITADHGGQASTGAGTISEGVSAETKGERVRIYHHEGLRKKAAADYVEPVIEWPPSRSALPDHVFPMLSHSHSAFIQKGKNIVGHGGISLHEVIVPLAVITGSDSGETR